MKTRIGALLFLAGLASCRHVDWNYVGGDLVIAECRRTADCYWAASQACPYGYQPISSDRQTTGAIANTHQVGNTTQTTFIPVTRGELVVKCSPPVFCSGQSDCRELGKRCIRSKRYPGKAVCADR